MALQEQKGWLMLLSYSENSAWGGVEEFYENIASDAGSRSTFDVEGRVWGKLHRKGLTPLPGDGIAFYHTRSALFPRHDPHERRARISLIGEIRGVKQDGQKINWLSLRIRKRDLERWRYSPIIRDATTESLFRQCGMVRGSVATFYEVPPAVWAQFQDGTGSARKTTRETPSADLDQELAALEGQKKRALVMHRRREARLRTAKIAAALAQARDHRIRCEVPGCGFDFEEIYGEIGRAYAEVHHLESFAERVTPQRTTLNDLAVICANCHRMVHRNGENRPLEGLIRKAS